MLLKIASEQKPWGHAGDMVGHEESLGGQGAMKSDIV